MDKAGFLCKLQDNIRTSFVTCFMVIAFLTFFLVRLELSFLVQVHCAESYEALEGSSRCQAFDPNQLLSTPTVPPHPLHFASPPLPQHYPHCTPLQGTNTLVVCKERTYILIKLSRIGTIFLHLHTKTNANHFFSLYISRHCFVCPLTAAYVYMSIYRSLKVPFTDSAQTTLHFSQLFIFL